MSQNLVGANFRVFGDTNDAYTQFKTATEPLVTSENDTYTA